MTRLRIAYLKTENRSSLAEGVSPLFPAKARTPATRTILPRFLTESQVTGTLGVEDASASSKSTVSAPSTEFEEYKQVR